MRLRTRILILVCVAALPLLAVQVWSGLSLIRTAREQAFSDIMVRARLVAGELERTIDASRQLLITLSKQPEDCDNQFSVMVTGLDGISSLSFTRPDGTVVCTGPVPLAPEMAQPVDAALMHRVIEKRIFMIGAASVLPGTWTGRLQMMYPVLDTDRQVPASEVEGVVAVKFDFDWLSQRLGRLLWSNTHRVTIADPTTGIVLLQYPETTRRTGPHLEPALLSYVLASRAAVIERVDLNGDNRILAHIPPSDAGGLVVLVSANADYALQSVSSTFWYLLLGAVGTTLLTLVLAQLGTYLVVQKPLARLTAVVRRRRDGDQSVRVGELRGASEVSEVARLIDEIADQVAIRDAALAQASADKAQGMAAIAHDKRHKLQVLQILLDRLKAMPQGMVDPKILVTAQNSLDDLSHAITQLMSAAALESNSMPAPDIHQVPIMHVLENVAAETEMRANAKGVTLKLVPSSLTVLTDPEILTAIVQNFADNAVKYTQQGKILIGVKRVGDMARIVVADTGIGVREEHQSQLFMEFHQVDSMHEGIGLGLGIVARQAPRIDAHVHLRSQWGRGSAFMVDVPLVKNPL